jgi:hypothetical protein
MPNRDLIRNWLRANAEDEEEGSVIYGGHMSGSSGTDSSGSPSAATVEAERQTPSSKSRLEPVLREAGQLERQPGPRKRGRPRIVASWFEKVAQTIADGTSLKMALAMNGIRYLSRSVRACYRNRTLRALYTEARRRYLAEHYGRRPTLRARIGRYM